MPRIAPHFGAVELFKQDGAPDNLELKKTQSIVPQWESLDVIALDNNKKPLVHVSQAPNAKTDVTVFNGRGGLAAIVKNQDLLYLAIPGSHLELPDTVLDLPGERINGSSNENDMLAGHTFTPQKVTQQAMILGAGLSSRFEPFSAETTGVAKPSVPLIGKDSVIVAIARQLHQHGIRHIIVNTLFMPEPLKQQLREFNKDLQKEGQEPIKFTFIDEPERSGTAGGLVKALEQNVLDRTKPLLIVQGDAVTNADFSIFLNASKQSGAKVTVGGKRTGEETLKDFGFAITDKTGTDHESGFIKGFVEKPAKTLDVGPSVEEKMKLLGDNRLASTGFYVVSPDVFNDIQKKGLNYRHALEKGEIKEPEFDYAKHVFPMILDKYKNEGAMWAERIRGYWADIGNPAQYIATVKDIFNGKMGLNNTARVQDQIDNNGVIYWPTTRTKVDELRKQASNEGSPFQLEGNIVVANAPK